MFALAPVSAYAHAKESLAEKMPVPVTVPAGTDIGGSRRQKPPRVFICLIKRVILELKYEAKIYY